MAMKPIKEFINTVVREAEENPEHTSQWHSRQYYLTDWNRELAVGGYYEVPMRTVQNFVNRKQATDWCREQFGEDHYCWTGGSFWFECEEHAVLFTLRWL
jgi:hypothetical protein